MMGPDLPGSPTAGPLAQRADLAVATACLVMGAIGALEMRHMAVTHGEVVAWSTVLLIAMPRWILLAATLPIALHLGVTRTDGGAQHRLIIVHLSIFLAISGVHAMITAWSTGIGSPVAHLFPWWARVVRSWYATLPTMISLYAAVLIATWGLAESRERVRRTLRTSQLEAQLQAARLEALRAKLQPHFLYNTLNGIAALVAGVQPARAVTAIEHLSELLHASLRDDGREEIPVSEEVALAERYLALQRMRFGERLHYELDVDATVAECLVPVLILQPIVENAVVHGLDAGIDRLHVTVLVLPARDRVELRVENDGTSLGADGVSSAGTTSGSGVGLAATRARLTTAYGDRASLRMLPRAGGGVSVRITVPRSTRAVREGTPVDLDRMAEVS